MTTTANNHDNTPSYLYILVAATLLIAAFSMAVSQGWIILGAN